MNDKRPGNVVSFFNAFTSIQKIVLALLLLLMVAGTIKAVYYTRLFGGADLRERIVNARVLGTPYSPYYYHWQPGDPETLINPNIVPDRNISGLTVAPGTVYIHYLFAWMRYPQLRMAWLVFQYLLLGYVFIYFFRSAALPATKVAVAFFGVLFFFCSPFWLLHIDRGQVYILYAFLFCAIYQCYQSRRPVLHYTAGLLVAAAVYCRPTFAVLAIPLFMAGNRRVIGGMLGGCVVAAALLLINYPLWRDYLHSMSDFTSLTNGLQRSAAVRSPMPAIIEGAGNLQMGKMDFMCGGIRPLNVWVVKFTGNSSGRWYPVIYIVTAAVFTIAFWRRLRQGNAVVLFLFGFVLYMLTDYIMPAPRGAYNLVQWVFAVLLMVSTGILSQTEKLLLLVALCAMVDFPFYFPLINDLGEALLVAVTCRFCYFYGGRLQAQRPSAGVVNANT